MTNEILDSIISEAIEKIILRKPELTDSTDLTKDLQMDSLDIVEFYTTIEEKFGIRVNDEDISTCGTTIKDVKELIKKYAK